MPELAAEAMIPNPRLAALAPFIGAWTTVGAHPMMPGLRWSRSAPDSQRYVLTISADGNSIRGAGELSRDGAPWEPDLELTYSRAK
jgi:hypothetical protein